MLSTDHGYIHKLGTDTYVTSIIMLPGESIDMYEVVEQKPTYAKSEYDERVSQLVRERYTESEEFAIQRKAINAAFSSTTADNASVAIQEFEEYNSFVESCKEKAAADLEATGQ